MWPGSTPSAISSHGGVSTFSAAARPSSVSSKSFLLPSLSRADDQALVVQQLQRRVDRAGAGLPDVRCCVRRSAGSSRSRASAARPAAPGWRRARHRGDRGRPAAATPSAAPAAGAEAEPGTEARAETGAEAGAETGAERPVFAGVVAELSRNSRRACRLAPCRARRCPGRMPGAEAESEAWAAAEWVRREE